MVLEKVLKAGADLNLPKEMLEKAHLLGRVNIVVGEKEIIIKKALEEAATLEEMTGLGRGIFDKDSVTIQRNLRGEWNL